MSLPIDRTTLAAAQGNQVPSAVASSAKNINAIKVLFDTIDELNEKVDAHAGSATLAHPDGSVTTAKIANGSIGTAKIADVAVTRPKIAIGAVGSTQLDPTLLTDFGDIAVQAEFDRRGVNLLKYSNLVVGGDWSSAIQAALATGHPVIIPDGVYGVSSQIVWNGKSVVIGIGYPVIKALSAMESVVKCDKDNNDLIVNGVYRTGRWLNVNVDANFVATNGFYVKRGKGLDIGGFSVLNAVNALLMLGDTTALSTERAFECNVHDLYLPGGNGATRAEYCIYANATFVDSDIQNIVMNNAKTNHANNSGTNNRWFNIHPYSYPLDQQIDTMWVANGQGNQHSQIYIDSPGRRGIHITASIQMFSEVQFLCPDFIDNVSSKPLIHIDKTTATQIDQIITNISSALDSSKRVLISTVVIDNSTNLVFDASVQSMCHVGSVPNQDVLITGKVPTRFSHTSYLSSSTNPYYVGQEYFNADVYTSDTAKNITFKNEMNNTVYQVTVELFYNTTYWISNKTTTGFRINFGTAVPSNGFVVVKVFARG
jgi:hypothetical protein